MKKIISLVLACMLISAFCCISVSATGETITVESKVAASGETVTIRVMSSSVIDAFSSLSLELGYNASDLELTKVPTLPKPVYYDEEAEEDVEITASKASNKTVNPYNFGWTSSFTDAAFSSTTLATFTFKVLATEPGTYPITIDYYKGPKGTFVDGQNVNFTFDESPLNLAYVAGGITIEGSTNNTITVNALGSSVEFETPDAITGKIIVASYSGNRMTAVHVYDAAEEVNASADSTATNVKVMWWKGLNDPTPFDNFKTIK